MKKVLFFLATAALALVACNKVETLEVNRGDAINFRTFASPLTRAASTQDITTADIASFKVTAFNAGTTTSPYIDDVEYTRTTSTPYTFYVNPSNPSTSTEYYWPANKLDFYAYSWTDGSTPAYYATGQVAKEAYNSFTYTPTQGADPVHADLVFATIQNIGKKDTYSNGTYGSLGIPLNFRHTASKITVKVKNTAPNLKFDVDAWKVGFVYDKGLFTLGATETSTAPWNDSPTETSPTLLALADWTYPDDATKVVANEYVSNQASTVSVPVFNTASGATNDDVALTGEMILVPQTLVGATAYEPATSGDAAATGDKLNGAFIAVKFIIKNGTNDTVIYGTENTSTTPSTFTTAWAYWPLPNGSWQPGKKYTYTIDLAGGGYYGTEQESDDELDPILEDAMIRFVSVTVDEWQEYDYDSNTTGVQPIPVAGPVAP